MPRNIGLNYIAAGLDYIIAPGLDYAGLDYIIAPGIDYVIAAGFTRNIGLDYVIAAGLDYIIAPELDYVAAGCEYVEC